jgi:hypothetical protein
MSESFQTCQSKGVIMKQKITKEQFYRLGGFSNPRLFRTMRDDEWTYWVIL